MSEIITKEMLADWRHANGYTDFNGMVDDTFSKKEFPYGEGLAIIRYEEGRITGVAIEGCLRSSTGRRKYCPVWLDPDKKLVSDILGLPSMAEPEFSLDEMEAAEELIRG